MHQNFYKKLIIISLSFVGIQAFASQQKTLNQISDSLTAIANQYTSVGKIAVTDMIINSTIKTIAIKANDRLAYMPFRDDNVKRIYNAIRKILGPDFTDYKLYCRTDGKYIEDLIPNFYRITAIDSTRLFKIPATSNPLITDLSRPYEISNGLQNKYIALWQSHGLYYDQNSTSWKWQRARVFQTVEDLYTQSYVLPFLVPMLENAGANVLMPRERDTQLNEIIVDNDKRDASRYFEQNDRKRWKTGDEKGFGNPKKIYIQGENPFQMGTFRSIESINDPNETSRAEWIPAIPENGYYGVYISYKTLENSSSDARYSIYYKGGKTDFSINQTMNGGTWLYLGKFYFEKGKNKNQKVILTNLSSTGGTIVTADAVKFGGGMGNIARSPYKDTSAFNQKISDSTKIKVQALPANGYEPEVSTYPRYTEGARYWLQWAGIPDSIYSRSEGKNDYTDDFQSRGYWVNYLVGGSVLAPHQQGLGAPVDLALAFHSDAGTTENDSIIGTLGIYTFQNSYGKTIFENGISRMASRDLTDIIQTQIVHDIRSLYSSNWTRRDIWNKSYSESRVPEVPTMLLELLSHQNFADMRYGLDPRFRFSVSRAIYKGMLKYLSSVNHANYTVQPLPIQQFSIHFVDKNKVELHWVSTPDSLEPTAYANQFVVYTRIDNSGFDNGRVINSDSIILPIQNNKIYSFKITAVNKGGESFPSEILSVCRTSHEQGEVLIVNGFTRLSAPISFNIDSTYAGFINDHDAGVPYLSDISFVGNQYEFKRDKPWISDDAPGFGASHGNFETTVVAGNSFDYPFIHGKALRATGYSFVSSSEEAVLKNYIDLNQFKTVDLILGKQKQTFIGNAKKPPEFKTFPLALQQILSDFCNKGGNLLVSGSHLASDLVDTEHPTKKDKLFIEKTLKVKFLTSNASVNGQVKMVQSPFKPFLKDDFSYYDQPNQLSYFIESPDAIEPADNNGSTICRYTENNLSAGIAYSGLYKICAFGFPIETITSENERLKLFKSILYFFRSK